MVEIGAHMWTAPTCKRRKQIFSSDRLRAYVRPVGALAYERRPRWFPQLEFL